MAYTQSDLDALKAALASGVAEVEYAGRRTRFRSMADLQQAISTVAAELAPSTKPPMRTVGVFDSGLSGSRLYPYSRRGC